MPFLVDSVREKVRIEPVGYFRKAYVDIRDDVFVYAAVCNIQLQLATAQQMGSYAITFRH